MSNSKRINYIDIAKGLAIICVIIGHTFAKYDKLDRLVITFIYSFHVPLFFILSGFFVKDQTYDVKKTIIKKAKQLLLPYAVINVLRYITKLIIVGFSIPGLKNFILSLLYANDSRAHTKFCIIAAPPIGMTWFLPALFFCQIIYICLNNFARKYNTSIGIIVVIMGLVSYGLNDIIWLPFSLQQAMTGLVFYHIGFLLKKHHIIENSPKDIPVSVLIIGAALWLVTIYTKPVGMSKNAYPGMCSFVGAICGTYFITQFSKLLERIPLIGKGLLWCGKNSIYIYALHAFDIRILAYLKNFVLSFYALPSTKGAILFAFIRVLSVLTASVIFVFIKNGIQRLSISKCH